MADVELVIKLPEGLKDVFENRNVTALDVDEMRMAIKNGTPLPKGHGRLIDYGYVVDAIDDWINAGEYNYTNATSYLRNRIRNVLTIIPAEGEDKE